MKTSPSTFAPVASSGPSSCLRRSLAVATGAGVALVSLLSVSARGLAGLPPAPPLRSSAPGPASDQEPASGPASPPAIRFQPPTVIPFSALPSSPAPLDPANIRELIRRHLQAIGGREAVSALRAIAVKGTIRFDGRAQHLQFNMWSARPNRVLIQTVTAERTLTEGYDGANPPWVLDSREGAPVDMKPASVRAFIADAEFDDILVASLDRNGISIDYAGEARVNGRPAARYLVTQNFTEVSHLFVDLETLHIVRRDVSSRTNAFPIPVQNYYSDYKPVKGVMLPTRITQKQNGRIVYVVINEHIEANPPVDAVFFSRPAPRNPPQ
ncbi:hypothetical protein OPIT5_06830 [Opitutaceae bacterium TAV5]|nr:hypothetical protein OPIT5_06830 [Opitutaceae bacterium TAV5]